MPRYPVQQALATMWWGPLRRPLEAVSRRFIGSDGKVLSGPLRGARISGGLAHRLGIYEFAVQQEFWRLVRAGDRVFDVGAHLGFFSCLAARAVGPEGDVVACEPNPGVIPMLRSNLERNRAANVSVVEAAVVSDDGPVRFVSDPDSPSTEAHVAADDDAGAMVVDGVTLDSLARRFGSPSVIKIDVEGSAGAVLRGGSRVLQASGAIRCMIEVHSQEEELDCRTQLEGWSVTVVDAMHRDGRDYPRHLIFGRAPEDRV